MIFIIENAIKTIVKTEAITDNNWFVFAKAKLVLDPKMPIADLSIISFMIGQ